MAEEVKETKEEVCCESPTISVNREINTTPSILYPYAHGVVQEHMQQVQSYYNFLALMVDQQQIPLSDSTITTMEVYLKAMLEFMSILRKVTPYAKEITDMAQTSSDGE